MVDTFLCTSNLFFGRSDDMFGCKLEVSLYGLQWRRCPKRVHTNDGTMQTNILCPAEGRCLFNGDSCVDIWWNNALSVCLALALEQLPGRHTDNAGFDPLSIELFICCNTECNLAAGCK